VLQVVIFHVERHPNVTWYEQCVAFNMFPTKMHELTYRVLGMVMMYGLPLVVIIISYACILAEIFRRYQLSPDGTPFSTLFCFHHLLVWRYAMAQLVEALRYKPEGRGFDSRWSHWNYSVT
jgi:hypothetical protein